MKNKVCRPLVTFLILTGLLLVTFNNWAAAQESVKITCWEEEHSNDNMGVNIKIPVITGMADTDIQTRLNALFKNNVMERKEAITGQLKEFIEEATKNDYPIREFHLFSDYDVTYNRDGFLSVTCEYYEYTGGAHGMTYRNSYNIDLNTGRELILGDLFKEGTNYKGLINGEVERQIAADPDKYFMDEEWGFKTIESNQPFYIEDAAITGESPNLAVYFGLYEIAPYASGIPEFKIPFNFFDDNIAIDLPAPVATTDFCVALNGRTVVFDVPPRLENGCFLVPMRQVLEDMGAIVAWYGDTGTALACLPGATLAVTAGSQSARINGSEYPMEVAAGIKNSRMIVPLEVIIEATGAQSEWDSVTRTLALSWKDTGAAFPALALELQCDIQNQLDKTDRDLATAAEEMSRTGLDGDGARLILSGLMARNPYAVDVCAIDYSGKIITVEPAAYHDFAGADISGQEHFERLKETGQPVLSNVFTAVEGFPAVDVGWPVFNCQDELIGSVSLLLKPEQFFASFAGLEPEMMVMQKEGYILYDSDNSQIGRNTFTDPFYQDYTGLAALAERVCANRTGTGTYALPEQPHQKQAQKKSCWTTVGLHGTEWRLIVNY